jgi:hypothetical protein
VAEIDRLMGHRLQYVFGASSASAANFNAVLK